MECPESIEELQELEKKLPLCRMTLYNQAKARIEKGSAKSVSDAARQLAEETGRKPENIRNQITKEQAAQGVQLSKLTGTAKFAQKQPQAQSIEPETGDLEEDELIQEDEPIPMVALGEKEILEKAKEIRGNYRAIRRTGEGRTLSDLSGTSIFVSDEAASLTQLSGKRPMDSIKRNPATVCTITGHRKGNRGMTPISINRISNRFEFVKDFGQEGPKNERMPP